ncbi:MAG: ribosome biogenesis GTPase Der [Myxococcota bacterium]
MSLFSATTLAPKLLLVGRMGVGKSSLFARLTGQLRHKQRKPLPTQSTRDWVLGELPLAGSSVQLVDTAGAASQQHSSVQLAAWQQTQQLLQRAAGVVLVTDATAGLLPQDQQLAQQLRATGKPLAVAVNKADGSTLQQQAVCLFSQLGLPVYPVSAYHGWGVIQLVDAVAKWFATHSNAPALQQQPAAADQPNAQPCFVVLGKPNAGKSTFLNAALQQDRYLTSPTAGTTAQAVAAVWQNPQGALYRLVDTAGLRRKSHVAAGWEKAATASSTAALRHAQVAVLLIDACVGVTQQDVKIASLIHRNRRGLVLVASKWDAARAQGQTQSDFTRQLERQMPFASYAPLQFVSAQDRRSVLRVLQTAQQVHTAYHQRLATAAVNRCLQQATQQHRPARCNNKLWKLYYACQDAQPPPLFYLVCNRPQEVEPSYERYLTRCLRQEFGFVGVPLKLVFRARERKEAHAE